MQFYNSKILLFLCLSFNIIFAKDRIDKLYPDTIIINSSLQQFLIKIEYDAIKKVFPDSSLAEDNILKISVYKLRDSSLFQTIIDTVTMHPNVETDDINMDGYADIRLNTGFLDISPTYKFLVYQPNQNKFVYSDEFSGLHDYSTNPLLMEIESHFIETGGNGGSTEKFRVVNNHLILFESSYSDRDEYEQKELIDSILQTTKQTIVETSEDKNGSIVYIVNEKVIIFDSLVTITKTWKKEYKDNSVKGNENNGIYESNPWSHGYFLFRKEEYSYKKIKNGRLKQNIKRYKVVNNKWKLE